MKVDSSIAEAETAISSPATTPATGPADRARQPPRDADGGDPDRAICHVTASGESPAGQRRGRGQEVVVAGAVVEVADRRRRPEQRDDPSLDERAQDEHVVALVGVPRARASQVREAQERRQGEQHRPDASPTAIAPRPRRQRALASVTGRLPPSGVWLGRPRPRAGCRAASSPRAAASASGPPAARSYARATLTAS